MTEITAKQRADFEQLIQNKRIERRDGKVITHGILVPGLDHVVNLATGRFVELGLPAVPGALLALMREKFGTQ